MSAARDGRLVRPQKPKAPQIAGPWLRSAIRRIAKAWSRPVSRVLFALRRDSHSSRRSVAAALQQPTREQRGPRYRSPIRSCSRWGLPCRLVAQLAVRSCRTVSPLPRTPCDAVRRSALCCTFRRLTPPRRYLAPCPAEPGLSSTLARRDCPADSASEYRGERDERRALVTPR